MKPQWVAALALFAAARTPAQVALPDSPGFVVAAGSDSNALEQVASPAPTSVPCVVLTPSGPVPVAPSATLIPGTGVPADRLCGPQQDQIRPFVDANKRVTPLTPRRKLRLAIHDIKDPFNLLTIAGNSAFFIATTAHNPYGPGMRGFAYNAGVSLSQDVTGELIGTFVVCSLVHQDPRYFRMPHHPFFPRLIHAISHVAIAQGDNGRPMPNYENFITSTASAEITNLYVPGVATNAASTTERIFSGFLTEPIGLIIAEFLPDVASHVHVNIVILQRYINQIAAQQGAAPATPIP